MGLAVGWIVGVGVDVGEGEEGERSSKFQVCVVKGDASGCFLTC